MALVLGRVEVELITQHTIGNLDCQAVEIPNFH